jgi:hypothetical protein
MSNASARPCVSPWPHDRTWLGERIGIAERWVRARQHLRKNHGDFREPRRTKYAYLKVLIPLDMALADNFPVAVDEIKFAEFVVFVFEIDCPIAPSGSGGIGAPG